MKTAISGVAVGLVMFGCTVASRAEHNTCNQESRIDRYGCRAGNAVEHSRDYIREQAPVWQEKINDAWTITKESAGKFGRSFKKAYED